jgi:hypothetical protein
MKNSMKITLRVLHDGTETVLTAGPAVIVAFERKWGVGIIKAMSEGRIEYLAWLAHQAAWREAQNNGGSVKPFDGGWLDALEDIEAVGEGDEVPLAGTP